MLPKIFIGSSLEGINIAREIQEELDYDAEVTIWNQDVFRLSHSTIKDLLTATNNHDYGVFIFTPDDITEIRDVKNSTVRDNVIFETGLFMSKLGVENVFYLIPNDQKLHIPSDLIGITPGTYKTKREDRNYRAAVGPFCNQIRKIIKGTNRSGLGIHSSNFFGDHLESIKKLFVTAQDISLFFVHSRSFRENNHDIINRFLSTPANKLTVYLPDFLDTHLMEAFRRNFDDGIYIPNFIKEAYHFFLLLKKKHSKNLIMKTYNYFPSYSFYKFDNEAIIAMYPTTPKRKNVPAFHIKSDTGFWNFFNDDVAILMKDSKRITSKHITEIKNFNTK